MCKDLFSDREVKLGSRTALNSVLRLSRLVRYEEQKVVSNGVYYGTTSSRELIFLFGKWWLI